MRGGAAADSDKPAAQTQLSFDRYVLDLSRGCLLLNGNEVRLRPKTFAVLSLSLADLGGVCERVLHTMPDMLRNFDTVSARPGHERNLMRPYFAAYRGDGVAEGRDGFWIPCGGPDLQLLGLCEFMREQRDDGEQAEKGGG